MIRREHIKQAVDAISRRDPEIGYSLDEMLGMGLIDAAQETAGETLHFFFEGQKVLVNRVLFFQEGTAPIEQGLLIKYGELVRRQEIQERGAALDYASVLREIHDAGLRLAVTHEIDYAMSRLKDDAGAHRGVVALLDRIRGEDGSLPEDAPPTSGCYYEGRMEAGTPAFFTPFTYSMNALMQVADMNLEFFHVRFILHCLVRGAGRNLLACVVRQKILGLVFLALREGLLRRDLEIKYIATLRSKTPDFPLPKGIGTFLVAGVWLLLKNEMDRFSELVLDAEAGARRFYDALGFESRGFSAFVLKRPRPALFLAILGMALRSSELHERAVKAIAGLIERQVKELRKRPAGERANSRRQTSLACIRESLSRLSRTEFRTAALKALLKYRKEIPEAEALLRSADETGADSGKDHAHAAGTPS
jgi:hypothetical protein